MRDNIRCLHSNHCFANSAIRATRVAEFSSAIIKLSHASGVTVVRVTRLASLKGSVLHGDTPLIRIRQTRQRLQATACNITLHG